MISICTHKRQTEKGSCDIPDSLNPIQHGPQRKWNQSLTNIDKRSQIFLILLPIHEKDVKSAHICEALAATVCPILNEIQGVNILNEIHIPVCLLCIHTSIISGQSLLSSCLLLRFSGLSKCTIAMHCLLLRSINEINFRMNFSLINE